VADPLTLRVITPDHIAVDTTASSIQFPASDGLMGVLPRHAPMVAALDSGDLTWHSDGQVHDMFVAGGIAEVRDNTVRVVTEASEPADEIDMERAQAAAERARERLRVRRVKHGSEEFDVLRAEASLRRALMRLTVANKKRK